MDSVFSRFLRVRGCVSEVTVIYFLCCEGHRQLQSLYFFENVKKLKFMGLLLGVTDYDYTMTSLLMWKDESFSKCMFTHELFTLLVSDILPQFFHLTVILCTPYLIGHLGVTWVWVDTIWPQWNSPYLKCHLSHYLCLSNTVIALGSHFAYVITC